MRTLLIAAVLLAFVPLAASADPRLKVVASHLANPRKLFVGSDGALYVVEAGRGGRDKCIGSGSNKTCVGRTGAIARVANGVAKPVVSGLWSGADPNGHDGEGPADVIVRGSTYDVLLQDGSIDAHGFNELGPDGATAGDLVSTPAGKVSPTVLANFAAFEAARNPDRGRGPGAKLGDPPIDSDPYGMTAYRGGFAVVDAAGNDLLWLSPKGALSVLAVFPTQTVRLTLAAAKALGLPASTTSISVQSVPTCVTVGPDGALYVGELTGVPYPLGKARVWRVVPGHAPQLFAVGLTNVSDLAFDGRNLLVLEMSAKGFTAKSPTGALISLAPDGKRTTIAGNGLVYPTGLAVVGRTVYISNDGLSPTGGEIVSLRT